ncbi:hypothetical protein CAPTEDRAFT_209525 [Capitella teleta]|uniref:Uncharacterized protein n=1 Tax=Capitella teleta TaxID=283909 RepID=R7TG20_CAPTE|nr:hypothetical protein CAPTEDRAFT_209525 [Capitella teleta]|eukprot:ELT92669.1 hypothetical protein CAPTEDRAFT_209525 [Capitella teleta]
MADILRNYGFQYCTLTNADRGGLSFSAISQSFCDAAIENTSLLSFHVLLKRYGQQAVRLLHQASNDEFELFEQTELGDGELAKADLWQETLVNKLSSTSTSDEIRDQLMASAEDDANKVYQDEVLSICCKIPCKCGSKDFRSVRDEEGMSTLAHVKVCSRCHHVMGVDESVLLEEAKEFLSKASFKTTECTRCGNTNPDKYRFEAGSGGTPVIRCIPDGCSEIVKKGSRDQGRPAPVVSNPNVCGPNLGFKRVSADD